MSTKTTTRKPSTTTAAKTGPAVTIVPPSADSVLKARTARIEAALKVAEESGGPVAIATTFAKAEVANEADAHRVEAAQEAVAKARAAKAESDKAFHALLSSLAPLAAVLCPTLTPSKGGNNATSKARGEVKRALAASLGINDKAAEVRLSRMVMAGALVLAHGTKPSDAWKSALAHSKNGQGDAFWAMVAATTPPVATKPATPGGQTVVTGTGAPVATKPTTPATKPAPITLDQVVEASNKSTTAGALRALDALLSGILRRTMTEAERTAFNEVIYRHGLVYTEEAAAKVTAEQEAAAKVATPTK